MDSILDRLSQDGEAELGIAQHGEAREVLSYLKARFGSNEYRKQEKRILSAERGGVRQRDRESLRRWASGKNVDLPLFSLYVRLKRQLAKRATG